jgi:hypothetical protein
MSPDADNLSGVELHEDVLLDQAIGVQGTVVVESPWHREQDRRGELVVIKIQVRT